MECLLQIAYRLEFKKWIARTLEEKNQMKDAKQRIQRGFKEHMGLIIDVSKHGSGTSNNGNNARRFFREPQLTSMTRLQINQNLIERFSIILQTIVCVRNSQDLCKSISLVLYAFIRA